jgi:hypothetical protein
MVLGQTSNPVQKTKSDSLQKKIKELQTPPSYWMFSKDENKNIDTVMIFEPPEDKLEVTKGQEKYKKEVIKICKSYSKLLDSLKNDRIQKMSKDSLYSEKEMKNRPKKYRGFDGGIIGYLQNEEDEKIKKIINRFLKIDRISSTIIKSNQGGQTEYHFYYYRTLKDPNGTKRSIQGVVTWLGE